MRKERYGWRNYCPRLSELHKRISKHCYYVVSLGKIKSWTMQPLKTMRWFGSREFVVMRSLKKTQFLKYTKEAWGCRGYSSEHVIRFYQSDELKADSWSYLRKWTAVPAAKRALRVNDYRTTGMRSFRNEFVCFLSK